MIETLVALAIGGLILLVAVPALTTVVDRSRLDIATRQLANDLRTAQSRAITTGWEYKLVGFGSASSSAMRNRYRLLGRRTTTVAWPLDTDSPFTSTTQMAGSWNDLSLINSDLQIVPGGTGADARYEISFNALGGVNVATGDFAPFQLRVKNDLASIRVSAAGGVTTQ